MGESSRYASLTAYLRDKGGTSLKLTFEEIEKILGSRLPVSARASRAWWANRKGGLQARSWMDAGYSASELDLEGQVVTFAPLPEPSNLPETSFSDVWTGEQVKKLRRLAGLTQGQLAGELAIRQQTVSDWESGVYLPRRSTSKQLSELARRLGFAIEQ